MLIAFVTTPMATPLFNFACRRSPMDMPGNCPPAPEGSSMQVRAPSSHHHAQWHDVDKRDRGAAGRSAGSGNDEALLPPLVNLRCLLSIRQGRGILTAPPVLIMSGGDSDRHDLQHNLWKWRATLNTIGDLEQIWGLGQCKADVEVKAILASVTEHLGFHYFFYGAQFIVGHGQRLHRILTNHPLAQDPKSGTSHWSRLDRFLHHARNKLTPLIWDCEGYAGIERRSFYKDVTRHGMASGVCFPVHRREGDVGLLSLGLATCNANARNCIRRNLPHGALIANCAHDAMVNIVDKARLALSSPLTKREYECLKWIAAGKSTWETAQILELSEHGVNHHVRNIMSKFNVNSRHQAVARAVSLGLI
ncbi:MAG TPA: LuxR C-terminal-related transcriptional regulator [Noviherbaspirillum sp.]|uniref:helix-turn-helix transcriptional regulator n=1 Tax=Noviherbaspirillum sp. TaxID=1926288 RepID=UPI002D3D3C6A|nr:LuxR C-terminal-related transcriptional regulator [Noviherbaspirillum sp.]HYD97457.1 LuxR C-terminal-related transcriptional regulator [Noviherbaspirillum sp.]